MPRRRTNPDRTPAPDGGAKIVSAVLKDQNVFKTGKGRNGDPPEVVLTLRKGTGFHEADFRRKARDLKRLGDEGKLVKTKPARREQIWDKTHREMRTKTRIYRFRMLRRMTKNPERRASTVKTRAGVWAGMRKAAPKPGDGALDPDHVHELQLGGEDVYSNLRLMDAYTNRTLGREIETALRGVPFGTRIRIELED